MFSVLRFELTMGESRLEKKQLFKVDDFSRCKHLKANCQVVCSVHSCSVVLNKITGQERVN